jgi:hypothetical protein
MLYYDQDILEIMSYDWPNRFTKLEHRYNWIWVPDVSSSNTADATAAGAARCESFDGWTVQSVILLVLLLLAAAAASLRLCRFLLGRRMLRAWTHTARPPSASSTLLPEQSVDTGIRRMLVCLHTGGTHAALLTPHSSPSGGSAACQSSTRRSERLLVRAKQLPEAALGLHRQLTGGCQGGSTVRRAGAS